MVLQVRPLERPASSTQVLRYRTNIAIASSAALANARVPLNSDIVNNKLTAWVRFALYDPNFPDSMLRRLPPFVYDDSNLAGAAPHAPVACVASAETGITTDDLSLNRETWAQNLEIRCITNLDPSQSQVFYVDEGVSVDNDPANGAMVLLDTDVSGLGTNTGLPVVAVRFVVDGSGQEPAPFTVDITFEIRHSNHR